MKRQTRPFIVEVKNKRSLQKRGRSIWGDIDLSAIDAKTVKDVQQLSDSRLIYSNFTVVDAKSQHNPQVEQHMADPQEAESVQTGVEAPAKPATSDPKKKAVRPRKAKAATKPSTVKGSSRQSVKAAEIPAATTRGTRKTYSKDERTKKLSQIEKAVAGGATIKSAVGQAGISEQTFYQWKKIAAPASNSGDLKDLLALEEENQRLKRLLAERLRKENAELKKKLGLA